MASCQCSHKDYSWLDCSLCRSGRTGLETYRRALANLKINDGKPEKTQEGKGEEAISDDSFNHLFSSMIRHLHTASIDCQSYHCSNKPHPPGSRPHRHYSTYHARPVATGNPFSKHPPNSEKSEKIR